MAVARMEHAPHIGELARELGVPRGTLYEWRRNMAARGETAEPPAEDPRQTALRAENEQLKRALAEKTLEVDFFAGALQKIEARRRGSTNSSATASTTKSEP